MSNYPKISRRDFVKSLSAGAATVGLSTYAEKAEAVFNQGAFWKKTTSSTTDSISNSLRFSASSTQRLSRTPTAGSGRKKFTISTWVKRTKLGVRHAIACAYWGGSDFIVFGFNSSNQIQMYSIQAGTDYGYVFTPIYRDTAAFYHIVFTVDTDNGTPGDRFQCYVNGARVTAISGNYGDPPSGYVTDFLNTGFSHYLGYDQDTNTYFDGYMVRTLLVDGQALTPSSFAETDAITGQWVSKSTATLKTLADSGAVNSFFLNFQNGSSAASLGYDYSSKANNWNQTNFVRTAGPTDSWVLDTPSNNFAILNCVDPITTVTYADGGLKVTGGSSYNNPRSSISLSSGKWYWETIISTFINDTHVGIANSESVIGLSGGTGWAANTANGWVIAGSNGNKYNSGGGGTAYGTAFTTGDIIGCALDLDNGKVWWSKNGSWIASGDPAAGTNAAFTGLTGTFFPIGTTASGTVLTFNFGQQQQASGVDDRLNSGGYFKYTPPTGFKAICTNNLPTPAIAKPSLHFDVKTYTGIGSITNVGSTSFYQLTYPYTISKSIRLNSTSPQYLMKNYGTSMTGSGQTWTLSFWIKRGAPNGNGQNIFGSRNGAAGPFSQIAFATSSGLQADTIMIGQSNGGSWIGQLVTNQVFADSSKWYHIQVALDTNNGTPQNRLKLYVDGIQIISFSAATYPSSGDLWSFAYPGYNTAIGCIYQSSAQYGFEGYLAEIHFIDGQALTPNNFGQWDSTGTTWIPKSYSGSFGTNGFYLNFTNGASTTALGYDQSGNSNNWTPYNFSAGTPGSIGENEMWMSDTPTNNFCTLNYYLANAQTNPNGSLNWTASSGSGSASFGNIIISSGKWYWEITATTGGNQIYVGVAFGTSRYYYYSDGRKFDNSFYAYGSAYSNGNVIGVKYDRDAGTLEFLLDNVSQGIAFSGLTGVSMYPSINNNGTANSSGYFNFGQRSFVHPIPSGFKTLCSANATTPATTDWMPALAIVKSRTNAYDWVWADNLRGAFTSSASNLTSAESTSSNTVQKFFMGGIQVGNNNTTGASSNNYVSYLWKGGTPVVNNAGSNTATIASIYSANQSSGFSVVTYSGLGSAGTVGHGLGAVPKMVIVKARTAAINVDWFVYTTMTGNTNKLVLNSTPGSAATSVWSSTTPTDKVFSVSDLTENGYHYVAYCFAEISGFSKFGNYTGNGSADGPFIWCGFKPKWVLIKRTDTSGCRWITFDSQRDQKNNTVNTLSPTFNTVELSGSYWFADLLSNGFKLREYTSGDTEFNYPNGSYIFIAFAEAPFKYANAR